MSEKDLIMLEEIFLGYIRNSKQIKLTNIDVQEGESTNTYSIKLEVDKKFGSTLVNNLNSIFSEFFNQGKE